MISTLSKKHKFDAVFDSQKVFRCLLEAMSHPVRTVSIKSYADKLSGGRPAFLALAATLLDNEVGFCIRENDSLSDEITLLTLAKRVPLEAADYIFVCDPIELKDAIESAKCGTPADPHESATLIVRACGKPACRLTLFGPGVDGSATLRTTQTVKDAIALRDAQNHDYPQGLDFIFVSDAGELFAVPRLVGEVR
ncbi:MAG: phosphonate C-P lyase system protein PhnH [Clostridiales Family XIII bacterium]|jgi:alpha-D-ribose 1-methylphosphonate 5-triphosphate synthase subunit PhnH|nr:phosphonate C-P lyase system protein PhnH [Clostridiales Family XIII bacterium]